MKKTLLICLIAFMAFSLIGCDNSPKTKDWEMDKSWKVADFKIYDEKGKVVFELDTSDIDTLSVYLNDDQYTYRESKIGEDANVFLTKYDWEKVIFAISTPEDYSEELTQEYKEKLTVNSNIIEYIPEISEKGYKIALMVRLAEKDDALIPVLLSDDNGKGEGDLKKFKYQFSVTLMENKVNSLRIMENPYY